jgi:hypothetical protein
MWHKTFHGIPIPKADELTMNRIEIAFNSMAAVMFLGVFI